MPVDLSGIQAVVAGSNIRTTWSISLIGASLLALLSTSYVRPMGKWSKLMYLFFIPSWIYLAMSIRLGDVITRRGIMATLMPNRITSIEASINDDFVNQLEDFNIALIFLSCWLFVYLLWWIFSDFFTKKI